MHCRKLPSSGWKCESNLLKTHPPSFGDIAWCVSGACLADYGGLATHVWPSDDRAARLANVYVIRNEVTILQESNWMPELLGFKNLCQKYYSGLQYHS